jgi:hypothetical protein
MAKPGRKPTYTSRSRVLISMEKTQLARAKTCAASADMPISDWIVGIVLAEFQRQDRASERDGADNVVSS